jgi:mono/diheme cytochrome c family protein
MLSYRFMFILMFLGAGVALASEPSGTVIIYLDKCARCHGDTGSGETPLGKKLHCKDYSSKQAQALFSDDDALLLIREGKQVNGKHTMPGYKDELAEADMGALLGYLRSLARRP